MTPDDGNANSVPVVYFMRKTECENGRFVS